MGKLPALFSALTDGLSGRAAHVAVGMDLTHHLAVDDVREGITTMLEARYGGLLEQGSAGPHNLADPAL
jgi:hypothetical protein